MLKLESSMIKSDTDSSITLIHPTSILPAYFLFKGLESIPYVAKLLKLQYLH